VFDATVAIYSETDVFSVFALYFNSSRVTHIVSKLIENSTCIKITI
jgi:hypothetical protein